MRSPLTGLGTFRLLVLVLLRPEFARQGESTAFFLYLFALPATALFVLSMVVSLVGFASGRVPPGDIAGSRGWCTGVGAAVGSLLLFAFCGQLGTPVPLRLLLTGMGTLFGAMTGWAFWKLELRGRQGGDRVRVMTPCR